MIPIRIVAGRITHVCTGTGGETCLCFAEGGKCAPGEIETRLQDGRALKLYTPEEAREILKRQEVDGGVTAIVYDNGSGQLIAIFAPVEVGTINALTRLYQKGNLTAEEVKKFSPTYFAEVPQK